MITASELDSIVSASGKIIDGNVAYIRKKRFEREHGYSLPVSSHIMDMGNATEPMIFEWVRANISNKGVIYSKDCEEIPLWIAPDCPLGASPDAFTEDQRMVFEFKTLVGNESTEFFMDKYTSNEEKRERVWKEHGSQILGQFISNPTVQVIKLIKYAPQRDEIMEDMDSPLAEWRGKVFSFHRDDYLQEIDKMRQRVRLIDAMISSEINPSEFKQGVWVIDSEGKLSKI